VKVGARRAVACRVGASVEDGRKMRATDEDRGHPRAIVQAKDYCKIKQIS
jgi:hypothetical protein